MIYPAIDLMDGQCVRLFKGDFDQRTDYKTPPMEMVKAFREAGSQWIHIVDLDGARQAKSQQSDLIIQLAQASGINVQTGGGLREYAQVRRLIDGGVARAVIGSLALRQPEMVKYWLGELGPERLVIALDVRLDESGVPYPSAHGWTQKHEQSLWQVLDDFTPAGLSTILVTDIDRDGVLKGANVPLYQKIMQRYPALKLITSGGVGTLEHIKALKKLKPEGIIIGKALYENRFSLKDAIAC